MLLPITSGALDMAFSYVIRHTTVYDVWAMTTVQTPTTNALRVGVLITTLTAKSATQSYLIRTLPLYHLQPLMILAIP